MIRKIVIPVRGDGKGDNVFAHAAALARRFDAHIVVTHCRPRGEDLMPFGVSLPASMKKLLLQQTSEIASQVEEGLKAELLALAERLGIRMTDAPQGGSASASWVEEQGRQVDVIKHHGRLADLICVAKPDVDRNLGANTLKTALFHTGTPVMMCPMADEPPKTLGDRITIGWNGSIEAVRAVSLTMGIIEAASEVTILSSGNELHGATAEDLQAYLDQRGITSKVERFEAKRKIGQELLERSAAAGADTLIMGAYSDSHERETIFGGNTQYVVDHSTMPVIFVH
ncbi:MAG: universal stress protein [Geminicoccaceae bacterium]